jgi:hypothetical protein
MTDDDDDGWATDDEIARVDEAIRRCREAIRRARLTMAMCAADRRASLTMLELSTRPAPRPNCVLNDTVAKLPAGDDDQLPGVSAAAGR